MRKHAKAAEKWVLANCRRLRLAGVVPERVLNELIGRARYLQQHGQPLDIPSVLGPLMYDPKMTMYYQRPDIQEGILEELAKRGIHVEKIAKPAAPPTAPAPASPPGAKPGMILVPKRFKFDTPDRELSKLDAPTPSGKRLDMPELTPVRTRPLSERSLPVVYTPQQKKDLQRTQRKPFE